MNRDADSLVCPCVKSPWHNGQAVWFVLCNWGGSGQEWVELLTWNLKESPSNPQTPPGKCQEYALTPNSS